MEDTRCARNALATNFEHSEDHKLVVRIRSLGIQFAYTLARVSAALIPSGDCTPPMSTRSGLVRSETAVPSARNSGLLRTWNFNPLSLTARIVRIAVAVLTGTVLFSTTILSVVETSAILRAQSSQFLMLAARPAPIP